MGRGIPDYFAYDSYNIKPRDVTQLILRCEPEEIHEKVIVTPCWSPDEFMADNVESVEVIAQSNAYETCIYEVTYRNQPISLVCSGIGAPQTGDVVLALGCTPCRYLVFTGSCGGLTRDLTIGDLLTITESIGGDGYSNYLAEGELSPHAFLKPAEPDAELNNILEEYAASLARESNISLHKGRIFSSDTIVAQFPHLEEIADKHNCTGIEMETSAVFNCADLVEIRAAALLIISDVITGGKSLFSGRTKEDMERYKDIKKTILGKIILDTLTDGRWS